MKTLTIILATVVSLSTGSIAKGTEPLKVMTYNVHNGVGLDKQRDHQRIGRIIAAASPDFVGIQEVDLGTHRSGRTDVLAEIAAAAGMEYIYAPAIDFDDGKYGIELLCKNAPDSIKIYPLPGREEKRTSIVAYFPEVVVINTHLSLTPDDALSSAVEISNIAEKIEKPVIITGDLNSLPEAPAMGALTGFEIISPKNTPTFPANNPTKQIDYILVKTDKPVVVKRAEIINEPVASDHRPIFVEIDL